MIVILVRFLISDQDEAFHRYLRRQAFAGL